MNSKLRIGIDFHGVITEKPSFFRDFSILVQEHGHSVHVLSGGPYSMVKDFLDAWGFKYVHIFSLVDYFASRGLVEYFENGNFKVPDNLWNKAKADYCYERRISVHIDDTPHYGLCFSTPFALYDKATSTAELYGRIIDFSHSPEQAILSLETVLQKH